MTMQIDPLELRLLDGWQRGFPLAARPFAVIGEALDLDEQAVIARFRTMQQMGRITRIGCTCAPNVISASTLAALAAPPEQVDSIGARIAALPGINHAYLREDRLNLWFVATGPDRTHVDGILERIRRMTGLEPLDLPLVRPFNVDLGFSMTRGPDGPPPAPTRPDPGVLVPGDRRLMQALMQGLPLVPRPYEALARRLGQPEDRVIGRIRVLSGAGIIARFGVIVRHRALGWRANAMVVWDLPQARVSAAGPALAALPGVTLCYERRPVPDQWPYRLYNMIHARARGQALSVIERARALPALSGARHRILFSLRCYRQTGALIAPPETAA